MPALSLNTLDARLHLLTVLVAQLYRDRVKDAPDALAALAALEQDVLRTLLPFPEQESDYAKAFFRRLRTDLRHM